MLSTLLAAAILAPQATIKLPSTPVTDFQGASHNLVDADFKATVLLFIAIDCPISNRFTPEYTRIQGAYEPKGVRFFRVLLDDSVTKEEIDAHAKEFKLNFPGFMDPKLELVKKLAISVTPEVAIIGPDGTMLYRGRLNETYSDHGRFKEGTVRQDVREALDEILAGKPVSVPLTQAIGCGIPDIQ
ncbi:MAG: redoxin domain-containing protein [Fimbriimonadaceae bacterium]|nr:redoxin domain-containing protein [Fimbriimonadaceae bacterium]QYK56861.1 MAG: redoxin domain-containing protein [Fimbriimonadaceae bacterium]